MMNKLDKDKFAPLFGTWWPKIEKFFDSGGFEPIYERLKKDSQRGVKIAPLSHLVYRVFQETDYNTLKAVILSYCPYHTFINNSPVADGIAFSCSVTGKLQPSLISWYEGLENDLYGGLNLNYIKNPDLSYLCTEGVLMLNSSLTVAKNKPGSHQNLWQGFTRFVLEECLAYTGVPILLIGNDAKVFRRYVTPLTHGYIFECEHPAFAARSYQLWDTKGSFSAISRIIKENGDREIDWLNEKCPF